MNISRPLLIRTACFLGVTLLLFVATNMLWQTVDRTNGETTLRSLPLALGLFVVFYVCVSPIFGALNGLKVVSGLWLLLPLTTLLLGIITNGDSPGVGFLPMIFVPVGLAGLVASLVIGSILIGLTMLIRKFVPLVAPPPLSLRSIALLCLLFHVVMCIALLSTGFSF